MQRVCKQFKKLSYFIALLIACLAVAPAIAGEEQGRETATDEQVVPEKNKKKSEVQFVDMGDVTVTGRIVDEATANIPAVVESITAEGIKRMNAMETSDVFKYMPGSYLRKLYPGGTNSPPDYPGKQLDHDRADPGPCGRHPA